MSSAASLMQARLPIVPCMKRRTLAGFTLLELLITMSIAGILMAVAVPSYQYFTTANRIASEINGLVGDLQFARLEAVREGQMVAVCPSLSPYTTCNNTTSWNQGWIVCSDPSGDAQCDAGQPILRVQAAFTPDTLVINNNAVTSLTFNRDGFMSTGGGAGAVPVMLRLHNAANVSAYTRCLATSVVGTLVTLTFNQTSVTGQTCT
jgi:type IV fimbrial biogenesis protein FimT